MKTAVKYLVFLLLTFFPLLFSIAQETISGLEKIDNGELLMQDESKTWIVGAAVLFLLLVTVLRPYIKRTDV